MRSRESNISAWYISRTKPTTAITRTASLRRVDREMTGIVEQRAARTRLLTEVLVSLRDFPFACLVFDEQARCLRDYPNLCYRQVAQMPSYCTQPSG